MRTVKSVLESKGTEVWSVLPDTKVHDALRLMAEKNIGALFVIDDDRLLGVFSERDYARRAVSLGQACDNLPVHEMMTERVVCVLPDQTVEECMALMTEKRVRHLPVVEAGKVGGVISIGDVVKAIISKQEFVIEQLENYITGGHYRPK
jgi:CBS domain-containing protein